MRTSEWRLIPILSPWAGWIERLSQLDSERPGEPITQTQQLDKSVEWCVLGMLRQLYTISENDVTSKIGAGEYGLSVLPERWHRLVREAIAVKRRQPEREYDSQLLRLQLWWNCSKPSTLKRIASSIKGECKLPTYPVISQQKRLQRLSSPQGPVRIVLDTDTFNEIDDQFAVVYALKSQERMRVEAFYAAPFFNVLSTGPKDGMEKSYAELHRIAGLLPEMSGVPIYRGSDAYLPGPDTPVASDAARNLVERALAAPEDDPLYVVAIGAVTNVASAILTEPRIIENIVVVWLGGNALHWPDTKEFNLSQDLHASRIVMNCGVPLVLIPCMGVASHLLTTLSEIRDYVLPKGPIGKYLFETFKNSNNDHFAYSRVIWDIAAIAYLANEAWLPSVLAPSPLLTDDFRWSVDASRHFIRYVRHVHRDPVFKDLFRKLG